MKKTLLTSLVILITSIGIAQNTNIDVVYLNNGSVIKGSISEMVINKHLTLKIDNGSVLIIEMDRIERIEKEKLTEAKQNKEEIALNEMNSSYVEEETEANHPQEKKKGKFWKALGNFAVATLNKTAENVKNQQSNDEQEEYAGYEDSIDEEEILETDNVGTICFLNPNLYSRKVVLKNNKLNKEEIILIGRTSLGKTKSACSYDLIEGIYTCQVYTTFSKKLVEQYTIRISADSMTERTLTRNNSN